VVEPVGRAPHAPHHDLLLDTHGFERFAGQDHKSPSIDSVIVVITARRSAFREADLPILKDLERESNKPVLMWTYTLPSERTIEMLIGKYIISDKPMSEEEWARERADVLDAELQFGDGREENHKVHADKLVVKK
jgi:hypothetical protein